MGYVAIADRDHEQEHHDPQTFITKYIWSQDHKVIAIQYSVTAIFVGIIAMVALGSTLGVLEMRIEKPGHQTGHFVIANRGPLLDTNYHMCRIDYEQLI